MESNRRHLTVTSDLHTTLHTLMHAQVNWQTAQLVQIGATATDGSHQPQAGWELKLPPINLNENFGSLGMRGCCWEWAFRPSRSSLIGSVCVLHLATRISDPLSVYKAGKMTLPRAAVVLKESFYVTLQI